MNSNNLALVYCICGLAMKESPESLFNLRSALGNLASRVHQYGVWSKEVDQVIDIPRCPCPIAGCFDSTDPFFFRHPILPICPPNVTWQPNNVLAITCRRSPSDALPGYVIDSACHRPGYLVTNPTEFTSSILMKVPPADSYRYALSPSRRYTCGRTSNTSEGKGSHAALTSASAPTASDKRRMGRRFVDGLNPRSKSMHPATVGHSAPFSHHRCSALTETLRSISRAPITPLTRAEFIRHPESQTTR